MPGTDSQKSNSQDLPENFQSSSELIGTGFCDAEFHRKEINDKIDCFKDIVKENSAISAEEMKLQKISERQNRINVRSILV